MFWSQNKKTEAEDSGNQLIFSLKNGKISILLEIGDENKDAAMEIGQLLYGINSGDLEEPIANMLVDLGSKSPEFYSLTQDIIKYWILNKNLHSNEAYISPLKVFQQ